MVAGDGKDWLGDQRQHLCCNCVLGFGAVIYDIASQENQVWLRGERREVLDCR